jgi:hypothetical protein
MKKISILSVLITILSVCFLGLPAQTVKAYDFRSVLTVCDTTLPTWDRYHPISRGVMTEYIVKAFDIPFSDNTEPTFSDVPESNSCYIYIEAAVNAGIVSGYEDVNGNPTGTFGPENQTNKAELAKIINNADENLISYEGTKTFFKDNNLPDTWYYNYVNNLFYNIKNYSVFGTNVIERLYYPANSATNGWLSDILNALT